jgi:hypothetical protein
MDGFTGNGATLDWNVLLWEPIKQNGGQLAGLLPGLINAMYILLIGWIMAFVVQIVVRRILHAVKFDKIAETTGIAGVLSENDVRTKPLEWVSRLVFWGILTTSIVQTLYVTRLGDLAGSVELFAGFIFQSLGLLLIFVIGIFLSVILPKVVETTSTNLKVKTPQAYSRIMKWAVLAFMVLLIIRQISIPFNFILIVFSGIFGSLCLAFIIAFGVGGREWAAKMLEKISK